jgi:hypothetical protein
MLALIRLWWLAMLGFVSWFWDKVASWGGEAITAQWKGIVAWAMSKYPDELRDFLEVGYAKWQVFVSYWNKTQWLIPINEFIGITVTVIVLTVIIRIVRWVKSFIPTVGD